MNHLSTGFLVLMAVPGILLLIYGFMVRSSPQFPTSFFSYKTDLTKQNEDVWNEANKFAGKWYIILAIFNIILWPLATYAFWDGMGTMIYISCGTFAMLTTNILITVTENHLNRMFYRDGSRKAVTA